MRHTSFKVSLILVFVTLSVFAQAQRQAGVVSYTIRSNYASMFASLDYISAQQRDRFMYIWGSRSSSNEYASLVFNQEKSLYQKEERRDGGGPSMWSGKKEIYFCYRDYTGNSFHYVFNFQGKAMQVKDSTQCPKWKIMNNIKEVAGEICMNATFYDSIKKQNIEAWFALNLPSQAGPDLFCGLPGLILEVNINNGAKVYTAQSIKFENVDDKFVLPNKIRGREVSHSEYKSRLAEEIQTRVNNRQPWFWDIVY